LIDETIKTGFDNMTSGSGSRSLSGINNGAVFSQTMNYDVTVQALNNLQKMITASVTWNEPSGAKQVILQTLTVRAIEGQ
ncbi:MAG: hypothetical protein HYU63_04145, partial [Armatimonadetes bacterium]|nr:hypothetical protein [Armatimonadota bacterium]